MSEYSIKQYQSELEKIIHFGGTNKETAIRNAFYNLLNEYAKSKGLMIVTEIDIKATNSNKKVRPDGTLKDSLRQDWGYWESKDESDDIDEEIRKKFEKGYPKENILFEDSQTAVLIQNGIEIYRVSMKDIVGLDLVISTFISFERPEVQHFRKAIELFKQDIPKVTETLRGIIISQEKTNPQFIKASETFLKLCHDSINPNIINDDVREMIIQHILTEDIFNTIFDENQFHRENNIARELESVINTFFTGSVRKIALGTIQHYYQAINAAAAGIADHHEKQKFLKVVYETFYKSYNPKAADRLGVVYTPNEIVQFMIKSTDYLLNLHFGKYLEDKGVEILDPATGTGTFICDMIDYMSKNKLEYKYKNEIHANEVAILPYYISNLNIEFTYTQKMGKYSEFEKLCFVDTLDNMAFAYRGKQIDMFSPFTEENTKRIKKQNDKKIAVIIGNPPYNANQANENDNNRNREYPIIDSRIKETFGKYSNASNKANIYDMYTRFYRWAMDRIDRKGIICFITNNSFINAKALDGFRKVVQDEFQHAYIINLGGNIRELSGKDGIFLNERHTIFGQAAAVGIAIMFLIKDSSIQDGKCNIQYIHPTDIRATRDEKIAFLNDHKFSDIGFEHINPSKSNNWINLSDNDFEDLFPLINESVKGRKGGKALFKLYTLGVNTNRDEWVYDYNSNELENRIIYFIAKYNEYVENNITTYPGDIKWSSSLKSSFERHIKAEFKKDYIHKVMFRPFVEVFHYSEKILNHRLTDNHYQIFGNTLSYENKVIAFNSNESGLWVMASDKLVDLHFTGDSQFIPLFIYDSENIKRDNLTDWGLNKFIRHYGKKCISNEGIFYYVYAVLHNPKYRIKYETNLKREFPRIPFYEDFKQWNEWGKTLMALHINYKAVEPYNLLVITTNNKDNPKTKLKVDKDDGIIILDENTKITGVPSEAWNYRLGNRSALEWVLDQYKEGKAKDPTIAEKFNTYRFADYKDQVIDLLSRVCTVSIETVKIIFEMEKLNDKTSTKEQEIKDNL